MDAYSHGPEQSERYQGAIVPLAGRSEERGPFMGTGLWVAADRPLIVAPDHGDADHDQWSVAYEEKTPCSVVSTAPEHSVVLEPDDAVPVGNAVQPRECSPDAKIGAPVFTLGFSGWGGQGMCQMRHAIVSTRDEERGLICVDTLTTQCNSGGPVWLAETGELIGTIQRGYTTTVRRKGKEVDTTQSLTGVASYKDFAGFLTL